MSEPNKQEEKLINSVSLVIGEGLSAKLSMDLSVPVTLSKEEIEKIKNTKGEEIDFGEVKFSKETSELIGKVALSISKDLVDNVKK